MNIRTLAASALVSIVVGLGLAGCANPPDESEETGADEDAPAAEPARYSKGTVGGSSYTCSGGLCICVGDDDCNDMFGSGVCSGGSLCHTTWCECQSGGQP